MTLSKRESEDLSDAWRHADEAREAIEEHDKHTHIGMTSTNLFASESALIRARAYIDKALALVTPVAVRVDAEQTKAATGRV